MRHPRIILPLVFLLLLGTSLFLLLPQKLVVDFSQVPTVTDGNMPLAQNAEPEEGGSLPARKSVADLGPEMKSTRWEGLTKALDRGLPVGLRTATGEIETYWMRPRSTVTKDFQITLGNARSSILFAEPRVYEGFRFHGEARADGVGDLDSPLTDRAFFAIVGDSFAAVIQNPDPAGAELGVGSRDKSDERGRIGFAHGGLSFLAGAHRTGVRARRAAVAAWSP